MVLVKDEAVACFVIAKGHVPLAHLVAAVLLALSLSPWEFLIQERYTLGHIRECYDRQLNAASIGEHMACLFHSKISLQLIGISTTPRLHAFI